MRRVRFSDNENVRITSSVNKEKKPTENEILKSFVAGSTQSKKREMYEPKMAWQMPLNCFNSHGERRMPVYLPAFAYWVTLADPGIIVQAVTSASTSSLAVCASYARISLFDDLSVRRAQPASTYAVLL